MKDSPEVDYNKKMSKVMVSPVGVKIRSDPELHKAITSTERFDGIPTHLQERLHKLLKAHNESNP